MRSKVFRGLESCVIRVAFIIESEHSAAARYRVLLNMDAFEREGVDIYPMLLPRTLRGRRKMFSDLEAFDAVVLQRRLIQPWEFWMLRRRVRVLGYDFDDAMAYRDAADEAFLSISRQIKFRVIARGVDFITAGNSNLAGLTGRNEQTVSIVPTPADTDAYTPAATRAPGPVQIGWIGSKTTIRYLDAVLGAIERVAAARPGVTLTVIADVAPPERPFIRATRWQAETEAADVAAFDIGIMPVPDNPWTRGKCGFKLLLYGACGLPSVASPVGANCEIIDEGETGLFASGSDEWEKTLLDLVDDADLRKRLGESARHKVEAEYSTKAVIPAWAETLKRMAGGDLARAARAVSH